MKLQDKLKKTNVMENLAKSTGLDSSLIKVVADLDCGKAMQVKLSLLEEAPFPHFESYSDSKYQSLKDSIENIGVQDPIRVWHKVDEDKWYILSGHHRVKASKELGKISIPAIVSENLTLAEAKLIVNDTNNQRSWDEASLYDKCQSIIQVVEASKELFDNGKLKNYIDVSEKFDSTKEACGYFGITRKQIYIYMKIGKSFKKSYFEYYPKHYDLKAAYALSDVSSKTLNSIFAFIKENAENKNIIKINENKAKKIIKMEKANEPIENIKNMLLGKVEKGSSDKFAIDFTKTGFKDYKDKVQGISKEEFETLILNAIRNYFD